MAEQRNYEAIFRGMEAKAGEIISARAYQVGEDEETAQVLQAEFDFIGGFCQLMREGAYKVADSGIIQEALNKAREDITAQCQKFNNMIDKWEEGINQTKYEQAVFSEKNHDRNMERHEKEQELHKLGLFDGAKKKELRQEIAELQPLEPPYDFNAKIDGFQTMIDGAKEQMKPYQNALKGLTHYQMKAETLKPKTKTGAEQLENIAQGIEQSFQRATRGR